VSGPTSETEAKNGRKEKKTRCKIGGQRSRQRTWKGPTKVKRRRKEWIELHRGKGRKNPCATLFQVQTYSHQHLPPAFLRLQLRRSLSACRVSVASIRPRTREPRPVRGSRWTPQSGPDRKLANGDHTIHAVVGFIASTEEQVLISTSASTTRVVDNDILEEFASWSPDWNHNQDGPPFAQ
jgi:hypothetical protein